MFTPYRMAFRADMDAICYSVNTCPICDSPLLRSARCSFAPKSPFLRVNGSPIRFGFRAGEKISSVVRMTVNIALISLEKEAWRNSDMAYGLKPTRFFFLTKQLQDAFQRVSDESAQQKEALHALKQKESKATNMVTELTAVRFLEY